MAKNKQTKARQAAVNEYKKQRKRVQQTISRAQKRGYRFPSNLNPEPLKNLANISTQKLKSLARQLKELTAPKIYKQATAISEETGEVISGAERRREERKEAAEKGRRTKYFREKGRRESERKFQEYADYLGEDEEYEEWYKKQRAKDEENKRRLERDEEYRRTFNMGDITYNRIESAIQTIDTNHSNAAAHLRSVLNEEIATFGKTKVLFSIGQAPSDIIAACEVAGRYNPGDDRHDDAILALQELIEGHILTEEEQKEANEAIAKDSVFSPLADE